MVGTDTFSIFANSVRVTPTIPFASARDISWPNNSAAWRESLGGTFGLFAFISLYKGIGEYWVL